MPSLRATLSWGMDFWAEASLVGSCEPRMHAGQGRAMQERMGSWSLALQGWWLCLELPACPLPADVTVSWCSVTQSCLTLCGPIDYSLPGSSARGIFQARIQPLLWCFWCCSFFGCSLSSSFHFFFLADIIFWSRALVYNSFVHSFIHYVHLLIKEYQLSTHHHMPGIVGGGHSREQQRKGPCPHLSSEQKWNRRLSAGSHTILSEA